MSIKTQCVHAKHSLSVTNLQGKPSQSSRITHLAMHEAEEVGQGLAWLNRKLSHKTETLKTGRTATVSRKKGILNVKARIEIKLARVVKSNEKGFYSYSDRQGKMKEKSADEWSMEPNIKAAAEVRWAAFISTFAITVSQAVQAAHRWHREDPISSKSCGTQGTSPMPGKGKNVFIFKRVRKAW